MSRDREHEISPFASLTPDRARKIDVVCDCFEHQLRTGTGPAIESLITGFQEPDRTILLRELLILELEGVAARGTPPTPAKYFQRFPQHGPIVQEVLAELFASASPPAPPSDEPFPTIPNYQLLRKLSHGGMGTVYQAMHTPLARMVAVKILRPNLVKDPAAEFGFWREMKVIGTLTHPHIVQARDAGKTVEGVQYLVMEYLVGFDLAELSKRVGRLPIADACEITRRVALALQYAHQHQLVHRDIKPQNVLFGRSYGAQEPVQVKVADFGLALLRGDPRYDDANALAGVVGTFAFMAPEQYWDQISNIRSDLYSLGCTLYYLLLGHPPFPRSQYPTNEQLMDAHRRATAPSLREARPDVGESLEELVRALLAKLPGDRPQTPQEVADQLETLSNGYDLDRLLRDATETQKAPDSGDGPAGMPPIAPLDVHDFPSQTKPWVRSDRIDSELVVPPAAAPPANVEEPLPATVPTAADTSSTAHRSRRQVFWILGGLGLAAVGGLGGPFLARKLRTLPPIDILRDVNLKRDSLDEAWQRKDHVVTSPDAAHARLLLRAAVPQSYRLEIEARRRSGSRLVIGLVRDGVQIPVVLDSEVIAVGSVDDGASSAGARRLAERVGFRPGPANAYVCIVHPQGLVVAFEDQIRYALAPADAPSPAHEWRTPGYDGLFVGTHHSVYDFHRITLTAVQP